jgi:hypothetical protein
MGSKNPLTKMKMKMRKSAINNFVSILKKKPSVTLIFLFGPTEIGLL